MIRFISLAIAVLLLSSCGIYSHSQNIYQFKKYEQLEALSKDTLFVIIKTEKEDIALLEKYGKSKRAQKIKANLDKRNEGYKEAFRKYYTFSPIVFWELSEHDYELPDGFYANIDLYQISDGDNGQQMMMELQVSNNEDEIIHGVRRAYNPYVSDFNWLVKNLNKDLIRINKRGLKLKQ